MTTKNYAERDAMALDAAGGYYFRHVLALTAENLHSKGDIAAELGHRDLQIDTLKGQVNTMAAVLKEARRVWLEEHDPRDGTDCVTPFDHLLYGFYQPSDVQEVARAALAWIDAVPQETPLPAMPGFDRDWAEEVLANANGERPAPVLYRWWFEQAPSQVNVTQADMIDVLSRKPGLIIEGLAPATREVVK